MIKLIIWDLDGVLLDSRDLHYTALNEALNNQDKKYVISKEEHLSTYDGLPTTKKLQMLTQQKGLPSELYDTVWEDKQKATRKFIDDMSVVLDKRRMLEDFWRLGFKQVVATNSIRENTKLMLIRTGLLDFLDFFVSNQDVQNPKPSTEMYLKCMIKAGVDPNETLIIEDSHYGRKAALASGAHLCAVKDTSDVYFAKINRAIQEINEKETERPKWMGGNKMNVLIPMAGAGSRFEKAGYSFPKPLIDVEGKPMIQTVVENINIDAKHIFIVQESHYNKYNLKHLLNLISPDCHIILVNGITEGAACTTLLAKELINNDQGLLIANSDQWIDWDSNSFMYAMINDNIDGGILTFLSSHPKWSFAKLDEDGFVCEVAEKKQISEYATCGLYYYAKGSDYVKYTEQMIKKGIRTNNEFYVAPVFNEFIADKKKIKIFPVNKMMGLGTPEDLDTFLRRKN